ncbi:iron-containing redox enzyme family protein [Nocardioides pocheonensis]|uniref:Iron-containing redox enzyme family protein n=1 Tax=Nocardioides pocheonensis TaxID=661485 RepID=A0A3N0GRP2_9ACTN|nr:iron-containing redox enzyme family protein [Nocardioides pocheonensis]RNM14782.1 iron-containing redox enzyme family protein [Nocardioides pocheonensis]
MQLPRPRGPFSAQVFASMVSPDPAHVAYDAHADVLSDEDAQIALWALYELSYRGFDDVDARHEWSPGLLATRAQLEAAFEQALRELTEPAVGRALDADRPDRVPAQIAAVIDDAEDAGLARFLQREATEEQYREFLVHRSIYHLKESDPHAFAIPRLDGAPKVALAELQYDEFGGGRVDRLHSTLFARALEGAGLDPTYGAHIDAVPAATLAVNNAMSLFALHRRLRGALMGHLAAFESTSSLPCRRYVGGAERLGFDARVTAYFDEHVEADAVHEQVACRSICQRLVEQHPELQRDVLLGAGVCVQLDARAGALMVDAWRAGDSALLDTLQQEVA